MVVGCWTGSATGKGVPPQLFALGGNCEGVGCNWWGTSDALNYAIFYRPSDISSPGPVPIDEWWGINTYTSPGEYIGTATGSYELSATQWFLLTGSFDFWTNGVKGNSYLDYYMNMGNNMGGALGYSPSYSNMYGANLMAGDQAVFYLMASIYYAPSGITYPRGP